ncbi:MAG: hypothetical protein WBM13_04005 [Bacteroidia bacterium]
MKKNVNTKVNSAKKITGKDKELGELKKPVKLKPLKEKEKKNWKNNLLDEDDDLNFDDDFKLDDNFDEDDEDFFDDDDKY